MIVKLLEGSFTALEQTCKPSHHEHTASVRWHNNRKCLPSESWHGYGDWLSLVPVCQVSGLRDKMSRRSQPIMQGVTSPAEHRLCSLHHWRWVTGPDDCITYCTALIELLAGVRPGACVCCTASHSQAAAILVFSQLVRAAAGRAAAPAAGHCTQLHPRSCTPPPVSSTFTPWHLQPAPAGGHWSPLSWPRVHWPGPAQPCHQQPARHRCLLLLTGHCPASWLVPAPACPLQVVAAPCPLHLAVCTVHPRCRDCAVLCKIRLSCAVLGCLVTPPPPHTAELP